MWTIKAWHGVQITPTPAITLKLELCPWWRPGLALAFVTCTWTVVGTDWGGGPGLSVASWRQIWTFHTGEWSVLKWSRVTGHTVQPKGLRGLMCLADAHYLSETKQNQIEGEQGYEPALKPKHPCVLILQNVQKASNHPRLKLFMVHSVWEKGVLTSDLELTGDSE